jgi:hypothetical protein
VWFIEVAALAFIVLVVCVGFGMPTTLPLVSNLSVVVMSSAAAGLVVLVVATYVSRRARRVVGILWDVITF